MYVRVYGADMVCRLIKTCFLIHIALLRSISKVLGASSFSTCVEYNVGPSPLSQLFFFFFLHVALNRSFILRRKTKTYARCNLYSKR